MNKTIGIALGLVAMAACAFCADNTLGTWKLNPEKSKTPAGQSRITSLTLVREAAGNGVKMTGKGEREDKSKIDTSYTAKYDGQEVSVSGSGLPYDTIAITQVDANTLTDIRSKKDGKYKASGRLAISKDGKTATLTTKGKNADGKSFAAASVYEKQ